MDSVFARLAQKISPDCKLLRAWPLKGGISAGMTTFEVQLPGGETRRYILRQPAEAALRRNPRAAQDEFALLRILRSLGLPMAVKLFHELHARTGLAAEERFMREIDGDAQIGIVDRGNGSEIAPSAMGIAAKIAAGCVIPWHWHTPNC